MEILFEFRRKNASMYFALKRAVVLHMYSALGSRLFVAANGANARRSGGRFMRYLICNAKGNVLLVDFLLCSFMFLIVKFSSA